MKSHDPATCARCKAIEQIVVKTCGCGLRHTAAEWKKLQFVGQSDDGVDRYEWRNCACGSTIGIVLGPVRPASAAVESA